jgi:hypothetical protein
MLSSTSISSIADFACCHNDDHYDEENPLSAIMKDPPFMLASPIMMVSRNFDIRRVYTSKSALRLSMDVPNVRPDTLVAFVKHSGITGTLPYVIVAGTVETKACHTRTDMNTIITVFSRKLYLAAECRKELHRVQAKLLSEGVLEIMAPKTTTVRGKKTVRFHFQDCDLPPLHQQEPYCEEVKIQR